MTESPPNSTEKFEQYFKWIKIKTTEPTEPKQELILEKTKSSQIPTKEWKKITMQKGVVPPIPKELIYNSDIKRKKHDNKITRKALNNPLVPIGVAATVACLIGFFFIILSVTR